MKTKFDRQDWAALLLGLVILLTLIFMPVAAHAAAQPYCYRNKAGVVCVQVGQPGQQQNGGSGITPVKRFKG